MWSGESRRLSFLQYDHKHDEHAHPVPSMRLLLTLLSDSHLVVLCQWTCGNPLRVFAADVEQNRQPFALQAHCDLLVPGNASRVIDNDRVITF